MDVPGVEHRFICSTPDGGLSIRVGIPPFARRSPAPGIPGAGACLPSRSDLLSARLSLLGPLARVIEDVQAEVPVAGKNQRPQALAPTRLAGVAVSGELVPNGEDAPEVVATLVDEV